MRDAMGLIGIYDASKDRDNISSVYMISDSSTASLFVFVLFPGGFHDVYEIASLTMYQNVFIIPISIYPEYISDIYRLVVELTKIKTRVKVISPDMIVPSIKTKLNSMFLNSLVKGTTKSTYVYSDNGFIAFDWNDGDGQAPSRSTWPENYHDIYCTFGNTRILLTVNKVDTTRIISLLTQDLVDYVYIPWQNPSYNSTIFSNFIDVFNNVAEVDKERGTTYANRLVIYGFPNDAAIELASEEYGNNFPINARSLFLSDAPVSEPWVECVTFGEAVKIATVDWHLTPTHCCCDPRRRYHPVWPRPYNPMMYAPPVVSCVPYGPPIDRPHYCCPHCGQIVIIKETIIEEIPGSHQEEVIENDTSTSTDATTTDDNTTTNTDATDTTTDNG